MAEGNDSSETPPFNLLGETLTNETKVTNLPLSDIKVDSACQARVTTDATTIAHYGEIMTEEGNVFPPLGKHRNKRDLGVCCE